MSKPARRDPVIPVAAMSEVFTPLHGPLLSRRRPSRQRADKGRPYERGTQTRHDDRQSKDSRAVRRSNHAVAERKHTKTKHREHAVGKERRHPLHQHELNEEVPSELTSMPLAAGD